MTVISNIDEHGINRNLRERYDKDLVYVSMQCPNSIYLILA